MRVLRLILLFAGFGLLPLWASAIFVYLGSLRSPSADYWNVAPWLIVMAIPACFITLAIAGITYVVYVTTKGEHARKLTRAAGAFALLLLVVLVGAGFLWNRHRANEADIAAEKEAAKQFVEQSVEVRAAVPNGYTVSLGSPTLVKNVPVAYTFSARSAQEPTEYVRVVVDVSRDAGRAKFHIRCVVPESYYRSRPASDPCELKRRRQ